MALMVMVWVMRSPTESALSTPQVSLDISQNSAQPGEIVTYTITIEGSDPDQPFSLYMELDNTAGLYFNDASLRVTVGDLDGAFINGYSSTNLLEIEDIASEDAQIEIEIDVYIPDDLALYQGEYLPELSYEIGDKLTVISLNAAEVGLLVDFPIYTIEKNRVSGELSPGGEIEYLVTITNPNTGASYNQFSYYLEFTDVVSEANATINPTSIEIDGTSKYGQFDVTGPQLYIDSIEVLPGNSIDIIYTVDLPKPLNDASSYQNTATVEIPNTLVTRSTVLQGSAFPVELSSFEGEWANQQAMLKWTTASELNNQGFEVEHSTDDINFSKLGFVEGNGTSQQSHTYTFQTPKMDEGMHTFRLRQIDISGAYSYSSRLQMSFGLPDRYQLSVSPNPFQDRVQLDLQVSEAQPVWVTVLDQRGAMVMQQQLGSLPAGQLVPISLDLGSLANGLYLLKVQGTDFQTIRRIVRNP